MRLSCVRTLTPWAIRSARLSSRAIVKLPSGYANRISTWWMLAVLQPTKRAASICAA